MTTEADNEITITLSVKQATQRHIEHLQGMLTKRNAEIDCLSVLVEEALTGEPNQTALAAAYKRGWQEAAQRMMNTTSTAAQELGKVHKHAWAIYLQGQRSENITAAMEDRP